MEYKRLTERVKCGGVKYSNGEWRYICYPENENCLSGIDRMVVKLCELEDKIENGTLVELPCKLGTPVYCLCENDYVLVGEKKGWIHTIEELKFDFTVFGLWKYGETLFLTREEAEKKLEGLKNGR